MLWSIKKTFLIEYFSFIASQELSIIESTSDIPTPDSTDLNKTSASITNIVTELRELQLLFSLCEHLITQTQTPDFSEEIFTIDFKLLCTSLKNIITNIEQLCEQQTAKIERSRGVIATKDQPKSVSRDPADNRKYDDNELRYLASCGPYRDLNVSYPQNSELKKKNKQCSFTSN